MHEDCIAVPTSTDLTDDRITTECKMIVMTSSIECAIGRFKLSDTLRETTDHLLLSVCHFSNDFAYVVVGQNSQLSSVDLDCTDLSGIVHTQHPMRRTMMHGETKQPQRR